VLSLAQLILFKDTCKFQVVYAFVQKILIKVAKDIF
jgi:hypothetical protein